jgi:XTP/dITP diphosphohydrolase
MTKQVLFGTTNPAKVDHLREVLEPLPIEVLSPQDLGIAVDVREDGRSPEENAALKARGYFALVHIPTLATDAGLYIERLPAEKQPGLFVRRIQGTDRHVTDEEVRDYYARELDRVGGESAGIWQVAAVLVVSADKVFSQCASLQIRLTARASPVRIPGAPLSSLTTDPATGRYYSEMSYTERPGFEWLREFVQQHLAEL